MPNPRIPKSIAVTCTNAHVGSKLYVYNINTAEGLIVPIESGQCVINSQNFTSGVSVGDVITFAVFGAYFGQASSTMTSAPSQTVTISLVQTSTTNAPQISL